MDDRAAILREIETCLHDARGLSTEETLGIVVALQGIARAILATPSRATAPPMLRFTLSDGRPFEVDARHVVAHYPTKMTAAGQARTWMTIEGQAPGEDAGLLEEFDVVSAAIAKIRGGGE